jgi:flagellar biogenesis protein FliO
MAAAPEPQQLHDSQVTGPASQLTTQSSSPGGRELFYKMLLSVLLVVALGVAAIYVSRKLLPRIANLPGKQIRVVETAYIAPRKGIHLIQIGTRRLLIASTNEAVTMLADVTESPRQMNGGQTANFAAELEART